MEAVRVQVSWVGIPFHQQLLTVVLIQLRSQLWLLLKSKLLFISTFRNRKHMDGTSRVGLAHRKMKDRQVEMELGTGCNYVGRTLIRFMIMSCDSFRQVHSASSEWSVYLCHLDSQYSKFCCTYIGLDCLDSSVEVYVCRPTVSLP